MSSSRGAQLITPGTGTATLGEGALTATAADEVPGLIGVSANGADVYFGTFDPLIAQDHNGNFYKIYDARTDGGFPLPPPSPPCTAAEECHGPGAEPRNWLPRAPPPTSPAATPTPSRASTTGNIKRRSQEQTTGRRPPRHQPPSTAPTVGRLTSDRKSIFWDTLKQTGAPRPLSVDRGAFHGHSSRLESSRTNGRGRHSAHSAAVGCVACRRWAALPLAAQASAPRSTPSTPIPSTTAGRRPPRHRLLLRTSATAIRSRLDPAAVATTPATSPSTSRRA